MNQLDELSVENLELGGGPVTTIPAHPAVGGTAELPEAAGTPLDADGSSGLSPGVLAGIIGAVAVLMAGGATWYAWRWLA